MGNNGCNPLIAEPTKTKKAFGGTPKALFVFETFVNVCDKCGRSPKTYSSLGTAKRLIEECGGLCTFESLRLLWNRKGVYRTVFDIN
jgi:hypothetical protein